ncbi:hypothetical protein D3C76_1157780 [compost metagenome]
MLANLFLLCSRQRGWFMENLRIYLVVTNIMEQACKSHLHPILGGEINPLSQLIGCDRTQYGMVIYIIMFLHYSWTEGKHIILFEMCKHSLQLCT